MHPIHASLCVRRRLAAALLLGVGALACSASPEDASPPSGTGAKASASGGGAGSVGSVAAGAGTSSLDLGNTGGTAVPDGPSQPEVCSGETHEGQPVPVDMYFLVDSSASMGEPVAGGSKWQVVSTALTSFLADARNVSGAVGIGYFPAGGITACTMGQPGCICIPFTPWCASNTGGSCAPADYRPAASLSLPPDPSLVVADLSTHRLSGGTPTRPALEGTMQYLEQWAASHPERKTVLVLATDGEPTGCDRNQPQDIAELAGRAWSGQSQIRTFVIGVGAALNALDVVAQAGGTDRALLVDTTGNLGSQFQEALQKIRSESTVACDFAIPAATNGVPVDTAKVNVRSTPVGSAPNLVTQTFMSDPNNCGTDGGWYYDDPARPTKIQLCEATCRELQSGSIQIEYGCNTVVRPR